MGYIGISRIIRVIAGGKLLLRLYVIQLFSYTVAGGYRVVIIRLVVGGHMVVVCSGWGITVVEFMVVAG